MTTLLDSPEMRQMLFPVSVEFYHEAGRLGLLGEDVELLDGFIFKKMPKSPLHEKTIRRLKRLLEQTAGKAGCFVMKESPLTLSRSEPEPDLAVVRGEEEDFNSFHPATAELVIEVSINTLPRDLEKAAIYAEAGVKEYWLVEPETGRITVFRTPEPAGKRYADTAVFEGASVAQSVVLPGFFVIPAELFAADRL